MARASTQAAQALEQDSTTSPAVKSRPRTRPRSVASHPAPAHSTRRAATRSAPPAPARSTGRAAPRSARPGPARSARVAPRTARPAEHSTPTARLLKLRAVAPSPAGLLEKLVRGRGWVAFVGVLLAGIVFLNVTVLEVNGSIANVSERATALKRENAELRLQVARLASSERIQAAAVDRGFALPAPGAVTYLRADAEADARRAERALEKRPDALAVVPPPTAGAPATPTTGDR